MSEKRWEQRFQNFQKAYLLLSEPFENRDIDDFDDLEKSGIAQRFELAIELAWKTLKDYLEDQKVELEKITPKHIVRESFRAKIITNGDLWIDMLSDRNALSHIYDQAVLDDVLIRVRQSYIPQMAELLTSLNDE